MDETLGEKIRQRAHELWEAEGRPAGREYDHWLEAEREVMAGEGGGGLSMQEFPASPPIPPEAPPAPDIGPDLPPTPETPEVPDVSSPVPEMPPVPDTGPEMPPEPDFGPDLPMPGEQQPEISIEPGTSEAVSPAPVAADLVQGRKGRVAKAASASKPRAAGRSPRSKAGEITL